MLTDSASVCGVERVLALSVDLPTVQMGWLIFNMHWALVSQFLLLSYLG